MASASCLYAESWTLLPLFFHVSLGSNCTSITHILRFQWALNPYTVRFWWALNPSQSITRSSQSHFWPYLVEGAIICKSQALGPEYITSPFIQSLCINWHVEYSTPRDSKAILIKIQWAAFNLENFFANKTTRESSSRHLPFYTRLYIQYQTTQTGSIDQVLFYHWVLIGTWKPFKLKTGEGNRKWMKSPQICKINLLSNFKINLTVYFEP